jgi:hypothetical protein
VSFRFRRFLDLSFSRIYTKPVCVEMYGKTPTWSVPSLMQVGFRSEPILSFSFCRRNTWREARVGIDRISLSFQADYNRFASDFNYCRILHRRRGHMQLLDLLLDLPTRSSTGGRKDGTETRWSMLP